MRTLLHVSIAAACCLMRRSISALLLAVPAARPTLPILVLLLGLAVRAQLGHASTIFVDPGTVGQQSNSPIYSHPFGELDIVFDGMKHVAATRWGFQITNAGVGDQTVDSIAFFFFLSDEHGVEIPNTRLEDQLMMAGPAGPGEVLVQAFLRSDDPIVAHDFHKNVFQLTVSGAADVQTDFFVDGIVGAWIPEPSTCVLAVVGFAGLAAFGSRRRKQRVARSRRLPCRDQVAPQPRHDRCPASMKDHRL